LKRLGVEHLYKFGSTARGEAKDDSGVDLFFDHEKSQARSVRAHGREGACHPHSWPQTNIMTRHSLHPGLRKRIEESSRADFLMTKRIVTPPSPLLSDALWSDAKVG
jgi:uncharacterized protein